MCRTHRQWEAVVLGQEPTVLSSQANRVFCNQIDLTTSSGEIGKDIYEHSYMHIRRRQALSDKFIERIRVSNYLNIPLRIKLLLRFAADFADMFEVRGIERTHRGTYYKPIIINNTVLLIYRGLDHVFRVTQVVFDSIPTHLDFKSAEFDMIVEPSGTFLLEAHVIPSVEHLPKPVKPESYATIYKHIADDYAKWRTHCTNVQTNDEFLTSSLQQSITDLRALMVNYDDLPIISAGIPWYSTPFGRDSLITSLQSLMINPDIARDALTFLAKYQGTRVDDFTNEEPGKILHEIRRGEMARCGEIPHVPYYGTVDATPLFLVLLYQYWLWTGDDDLVRSLLPNAERALNWIDSYGDVDADGFVEYWRYTERGCLHQGWKDSVDGVTFPDGMQPQLPIALVEVQGYVYEAKLGMSRLYRALGQQEKGKALRAQAELLKDRIEESFWLRDLKYYALALDGRKRPMATVTSNPAHLLFSRAVSQTGAARIERRLMSDDMFSGWGIRTLSSSHCSRRPVQL
jgi:glycogen debranching enzyme